MYQQILTFFLLISLRQTVFSEPLEDGSYLLTHCESPQWDYRLHNFSITLNINGENFQYLKTFPNNNTDIIEKGFYLFSNLFPFNRHLLFVNETRFGLFNFTGKNHIYSQIGEKYTNDSMSQTNKQNINCNYVFLS